MTQAVWATSAALFAAGLAMTVLRRELVGMLLGVELLIVAANLSLVYHAGLYQDPEGLSAGLLVLAVAAAEAVAGLTLILALARTGRSAETLAVSELKG